MSAIGQHCEEIRRRNERIRGVLTPVVEACNQYLDQIRSKVGHGSGRRIIENLQLNLGLYEYARLQDGRHISSFLTSGVSIASMGPLRLQLSNSDGAGAGIRRVALSMFHKAKIRSTFFTKEQLVEVLCVLGEEEYRVSALVRDISGSRFTDASHCDYTNNILEGCELFLAKCTNPFFSYFHSKGQRAVVDLQRAVTAYRQEANEENTRAVYQAVISLGSAKGIYLLSENNLLGLLSQIGTHSPSRPRSYEPSGL